jgi:acyl dehydratase
MPPAVGARSERAIAFSQNDFDTFARLSGDDNPIHVDPGFAAGTMFGHTVAHGMMLFGVLSATVGRWLETPAVVHTQQLMFPAPTFADLDHRIRLELLDARDGRFRVGQSIVDPTGTETAVGEVLMGPAETPVASSPASSTTPPSDADQYKGMRLGMGAALTRAFTKAEVDEYCDLVYDDQGAFPDEMVPPALLGGAVSYLLGVELPGRGSNWLRQRYDFTRPVRVGQEVVSGVEIVRFRPGKHLVNLACTLVVEGDRVGSGDSLVHTQDVAPRT